MVKKKPLASVPVNLREGLR